MPKKMQHRENGTSVLDAMTQYGRHEYGLSDRDDRVNVSYASFYC